MLSDIISGGIKRGGDALSDFFYVEEKTAHLGESGPEERCLCRRLAAPVRVHLDVKGQDGRAHEGQV